MLNFLRFHCCHYNRRLMVKHSNISNRQTESSYCYLFIWISLSISDETPTWYNQSPTLMCTSCWCYILSRTKTTKRRTKSPVENAGTNVLCSHFVGWAAVQQCCSTPIIVGSQTKNKNRKKRILSKCNINLMLTSTNAKEYLINVTPYINNDYFNIVRLPNSEQNSCYRND